MKQEQDVSTTTDKQAPSVKPTKPAKRVVNFYEPYATPSLLYHVVRWLAIVFFHTTARISLRGLYNVPRNGPFIVAANHLAWTDIPLIALHVHGKIVYMGKEEYFSTKLTWIVRLMGAFPVKRGEADRQALRTGEEQLKKGNIIGIFPEGTRSRTRALATAHAGMGLIALRTGVPIVPVAIWGSEDVLKKFRASVTICYGEPVVLTPKGKKITREDIDEATEKVMRKIAEMLPPAYRGVYAEQQATSDA